jgi:A/G-specific adenine glycosylase
MDDVSKREFLQVLHGYYVSHGRHDLPWRQAEPDGTFDPYRILVSEIMLQQTQVARVIPKFHDFSRQFPSVDALADAPLGDVLVAWQGLGYNRRAKFLWQAAQMVVRDFGGQLPRDQESLEMLPGVGHNTAGAIMAYAFNESAVFVETNIRTVYIHHFFRDESGVADAEILPLLEQTLDAQKPRVFYWALMDYGSFLKQTVGNLSRASTAYARQSKFHGSLRQLRGKALRELAASAKTEQELLGALDDERATDVLSSLEREGLVRRAAGRYRFP